MNLKTIKSIGAVIALVLQVVALMSFGSIVMAQGQGGGGLDIDVDVNEGGNSAWYGQWWVWAVGLAAFLVVVIALTSRGRA